MARAAIVLQARMGSRRLPGKVLARVGDRPLLAHAVARLDASGLPVIVATTDGDDDDVIADVARRLGAAVFRGAARDVLRRYHEAARQFELDVVVRATADNPFVDTTAAARVVTLAERLGADCVVESGLPVGAGVEAVTSRALARAEAMATDAYDREHVTTLIRRDPAFRALRSLAPADVRRPGLRLTVDTPEDLEFARRVWRALERSGRAGEALPSLAAIIAAAVVTPRPACDELRARGA